MAAAPFPQVTRRDRLPLRRLRLVGYKKEEEDRKRGLLSPTGPPGNNFNAGHPAGDVLCRRVRWLLRSNVTQQQLTIYFITKNLWHKM